MRVFVHPLFFVLAFLIFFSSPFFPASLKSVRGLPQLKTVTAVRHVCDPLSAFYFGFFQNGLRASIISAVFFFLSSNRAYASMWTGISFFGPKDRIFYFPISFGILPPFPVHRTSVAFFCFRSVDRALEARRSIAKSSFL